MTSSEPTPISASDSGVGSEFTFVYQNPLVTDTGTGDETTTLVVGVGGVDSGLAEDFSYIEATLPLLTDEGTGTDFDAVLSILAYDSAEGTDTVVDTFANVPATDGGIGEDGTIIFADLPTVYDEGVGEEFEYAYNKPIRYEDFVTYNFRYKPNNVRYLAQNIFTRKWVHTELPLSDVEITYQYNAPNVLKAVINGQNESMKGLDPDFTPECTWIHVEENSKIIGSFILLPFLDSNESQVRQVEGVGFSQYPNWVEYQGAAYRRVQFDPAHILFDIWAHVQSYNAGKLGVQLKVGVTSPVKIGTLPKNVSFTTGSGQSVDFEAGPYDLNWWEVSNCGKEIDKLCAETPLEYIERNYWVPGRQDVAHILDYNYPRIGTRLMNTQFIEGQNLIDVIPGYNETKEGYPSDIIVVGAGEGKTAIRGYVSRNTGRLRRTKTIQDQSIKTVARAQALAEETARRLDRQRYFIDSIVVNTDHPNAPLGSWSAGDDVYVEAQSLYRETVRGWFRIDSYTKEPGNPRATITLSPSDSFAY